MISPIGTPAHEKPIVLGDSINESIQENLIPLPVALYEGKKEPEAKILKTQYLRETPLNVTFERLVQYHDGTPEVRLPVSAYRELITGTEMVFSSESSNSKAIDVLNEWVRRTNFYDKFENMVTTLLICGNAILEKLSESETDDVLEVDMTTIISKKRTDTGELEWYDHRSTNGRIDKLGEGNIERFIEFNLTNYSRQAWGRSLFYPAAIPRKIGLHRVTPPLIELLWGAQDAAGAILNNDAYPIKTITYPGANDKFLEKERAKWIQYNPGDTRIQKIKPDIEFFESQHSAGRYESHFQQLTKAIELACQFPTDIMTGDFTSRASSETTENITTKLVRGYQRYLCNKLKAELFEPILEQNGFEAEEVDLTIAFTTQNVISLDVPQVKDLFNAKILSIGESRQYLRDNTGMELPDDDILAQDVESDKQNQVMNDKVNKLESKIKLIQDENTNDSKLMELKDKIDLKLDSLKEAMDKNNQSLFKRREKVLDGMIQEAKKLG